MKKKILSLLLALAVILSAFSGMLVSASATDDVEALVKSAFKTYVAKTGNASTGADALAAVNEAIAPYIAVYDTTETDTKGYFIRHSADGVKDGATASADYPLNIPGHDGAFAAQFLIKDENGTQVCTVGTAASIPHTVEDLGTLTTEIYSVGNSNFEVNANGNITAYTGNAEKIVIPYIEGTYPTFATSAASTVATNGTNNLDKVKVIMIYSNKKQLPTKALENTTSLKAVVLGVGVRDIREKAFSGSSVKYMLMSASMHYNANACVETGNGYFDYGAFQNAKQLQNITLATYQGWSKGDRKITGYAAYNMPDYVNYNASGNIYDNTALLDLYYKGSGTQNISSKTGGTASVAGERIGPSKWISSDMPLNQSAALAQIAADSIAIDTSSTADSVKDAIVSAYINTAITAEWTETPVIDTTAFTVDGVLTLALDGKEIDIDVCNIIADEEKPTIDEAVIADIKSAFKSYVSQKGNASAKDTLVTFVDSIVNNATVSIESDEHFFIYHAVDGVYDKAADYPVSIPGHDGYVSAVFTVADANGVVLGTVGAVDVIPHIEENLGTLTTDVYSADSAVFTTDASGNITGYSGSAEKIVIPASFSGTINLKDAAGKDSVKAIVIGDRSATKRNIRIANDSFKNWGSLRAVVLPKQIANTQGIGEAAFANNANLKYVNMPHGINGDGGSGYGYLNYGAFQNCVVLENAMCSCCGKQPSCTFFSNVYNNTAIRYVVTPQWCNGGSYTNISTHSYTEGTFVYLTHANNANATLTRAATLAQEAANKYAYSEGDSADTVKAAIVAGYSAKTLTSAITADWNDTFTVTNGKASGILTLTQGDYSVDVEFNYNPYAGLNSLSVDGYSISPEFDAETYEYTLSVLGTVNSVNINVSPVVGAQADLTSGAYDLEIGENVFTINSKLTSGTVVTYTLKITRQEIPTETIDGIEKAFKAYVDNKGNNAEPEALLSYINNAIAPASVEYDTNGIFIRHAVDGVYDENDDSYPIVIKGHDGSVAITLKVYNKDGALVANYGGLASIPHKEENLGELTYDIFSYDDVEFGDSAFGMDSDGNITGYTGDAEKIIIPSDFAGKIAFTADSVPNKDSIKAVVIGGSDCASMTLIIENNSFSGWQLLRAVELPRKMISNPDTGIGAFAFAYNPVLKYVDLPGSLNNTSGGYGAIKYEAFRDCPVLENVTSSNTNGSMPSAQFQTNIFMGTAVRDYIYEGWYQFGTGANANNVATNPTYKEGTQVILAAGGDGGALTPTFTRAATMAQEMADTLTVTADNAASALTTITGTYSSKLTNVKASWADDYSGLVLTYGNYSITVICNKESYNTAIGITMNSGVDYRFNAPCGIRFTYNLSGLDALLNDDSVADVKLGTLIAPADFISGDFTHFELTNKGKSYLDIVATYIKDSNSVAAVLSNIKEENYNREFSAIGYAMITYTDGTIKYVYADECVAARPSSVAENVLENGSSLTDEEKNVLESIVDTAAAYTMNWIDTEYSSSDAQAMTMRNSILATSSASVDTTVYTGETYYINEENFDTYKSMLSMIPSGSIVLFERGGTYRVGGITVPQNNIYFGAYGEGAKPNIYGSAKNFADSTWKNESANIWSVSDITALEDNDAGIVIFDDGKKAGTKKATLAEVTADGDFWYDSANDKVYLYSAVNPADAWNSIEIGVNAYIFEINGKNNITVDNLNIRYTGAHGISIQGGSSNVNITNCEIGYIGGSYMTHTGTSTVRFGNGVEIWCAASNVTVDNCWVHQIYDTGLTHQGTATVNSGSLFTQENITFSNNLIEYCALASIEYWTSSSGSATDYNWFKNITYSDNICRFAGYGFGTQGVSRTGYHLYTSKDALNAISADGDLDTFYVSGNIFDTARGGLMQLAGCHYVSALPQLSGNTYIQNNGGVLGVLATEFSGGSTTATTNYYADSQASTTMTKTFKDATATVIVY